MSVCNGVLPGATQFGTDRSVGLAGQQQEDGVATAVSIELAGLNEPFQQRVGKPCLAAEIRGLDQQPRQGKR